MTLLIRRASAYLQRSTSVAMGNCEETIMQVTASGCASQNIDKKFLVRVDGVILKQELQALVKWHFEGNDRLGRMSSGEADKLVRER